MEAIEGLVGRAARGEDGTAVTVYGPSGPDVRGGQRLRVTVWPDETARVLLVDSDGTQPGIERGEDVLVTIADASVLSRVVRAMASIHLAVEEAENGHSPADRMLVGAGFGIGRSGAGKPAWMHVQDGWTMVVDRAEGGGLPGTPADATRATLVGPNGRSVVGMADDLPSALVMLGGGTMRNLFDPLADVVFTASTPEGKTRH